MNGSEYQLMVQQRFEDELNDSLDYYEGISSLVRVTFQKQLSLCFDALRINPYYQIRYKNVRAIPLKKFPYVLFFYINEESKQVFLLSCFQAQQSTRRYPNLK